MLPSLFAWILAVALVGLGNTVGYHRLLTHRAFRCGAGVRAFWTLLGALYSGSPALWVGLHRLHHTRSDTDEDPHSPRAGALWAHAGWIPGTRSGALALVFALSGFGQQAAIVWHDLRRLAGRNPPAWRQLCPDLMKEPLMRALDTPGVMPLLFLAQLGAAWVVGGGRGILWLWAAHLWLTNTSWAVNSICHSPRFGRQPHATGDDSRDVPWLALATHGESYHNSHHRYPRSARHGLDGGWDLSWWVIAAMTRLKLASEPWLPKGR